MRIFNFRAAARAGGYSSGADALGNDRLRSGTHKPEAAKRPLRIRVPHPAADCDIPLGERVPEGRAESRDPVPIRPTLHDDEERGNPCGGPAARSSDLRRQADLPIERRLELLCVGDRRLHLDDEQDPRLRVEREDVDRAPLAELVERDLGQDVPGVSPKRPDDLLDGRRVAPVEQPIKGVAIPGQTNEDTRLEGGRELIERRDRGSRRVPALHPAHDAARDAGALRQLFLGQPLSDPDGPDTATERDLVHARDLDDRAMAGTYPSALAREGATAPRSSTRP